MRLENFTKVQQMVVTLNLMDMVPHREIARHLQKLYEGIKPSAMTQEEYEEIVIKRCKDYVSNKKRKPYHEIKKGRDIRRDKCVEYVRYQLVQLYVEMKCEFWRTALEQISLAQANQLVDKINDVKKEMHTLVFGNDPDDDLADAPQERPTEEEEETFWEGWGDTEWEQILEKRKKSLLKTSVNIQQI